MTDDKNDEGMEALAVTLAIMRSPWDRVYNPETGALSAMFPKVPNHAPGSVEQRAVVRRPSGSCRPRSQ